MSSDRHPLMGEKPVTQGRRAAAKEVAHLSPAERVARGKAARNETPRRSHGRWQPATNRPDPIDLLEEQGTTRVPELVPLRYGRMLVSPFTFYRGAALIMANDLSATPRSGLTTQICGDAHLSNFGVFASPERRLMFDINDSDETLPGPWEWDVKRLAASFEIAGRDRGFESADRRAIVRAGVAEYRSRMHQFADARNLEVWYAHIDVETIFDALKSTITKKQQAKAEANAAKARTHDSMQAFTKLTHEVDGQRDAPAAADVGPPRDPADGHRRPDDHPPRWSWPSSCRSSSRPCCRHRGLRSRSRPPGRTRQRRRLPERHRPGMPLPAPPDLAAPRALFTHPHGVSRRDDGGSIVESATCCRERASRMRVRPVRLNATIAWLFMAGSACFVVGSVPAYLNAIGGWADGVTYVIGSVFFTSASYLQLVQAQSPATTAVDGVTQDQPAPARLWAWVPHDRSWLAAAVQLPGTLFFNISTIAALTHNATAAESDRYVWRPDLYGSVLFLASSAIGVLAVSHRFFSVHRQSFPWRIAWLNMLGSVLFMASAIASYVVPSTDALLSARLAVAGTFWGAACFLVGAAMMLPAWRRALATSRDVNPPGLHTS